MRTGISSCLRIRIQTPNTVSRSTEEPIATPTSSHTEYTQVWYESVLRNSVVNKSVLHVDAPGRHTLRIRTGDPGMVIQKIVIDFGGMKRSYLGPPSTQVATADSRYKNQIKTN